jgi:hypothetical protein
MDLSLFAVDRQIWNPRAGKMSWGGHDGWCFELRLFGFTFIFASGAR